MDPATIKGILEIIRVLDSMGATDWVKRKVKEIFAEEEGISVSDLEEELQKNADILKNPESVIQPAPNQPEPEPIPDPTPEPDPTHNEFPYFTRMSHLEYVSNQSKLRKGDTVYRNIRTNEYFAMKAGIGTSVPEGFDKYLTIE